MKRSAALAAVIMLFLPALALAQSCSVWFDSNPINAGQGTTMHWSWSGSQVLNSTNYFGINNYAYPVYGGGSIDTAYGAANSAWVAPGATTDYTGTVYHCTFWAGCFGPSQATPIYSCPATLTVIQDPCPTYIETPWQGSGLLLYSGATRKITQAGYNNCVTNYSGYQYFIPANSASELSTFFSAASRLGVSVF